MPVREVVAALAATVICAVPLPLPDVPEITVNHEALLVAVHVHDVVAVTVTLNVPPAEVGDWLVGEML